MIKSTATLISIVIATAASLIAIPYASAGDTCPYKNGKWEHPSSDAFQPAVVTGTDTRSAFGFIKTGHHMEGEKHGSGYRDKHHGAKMKSKADIVDTAISTGTFNTLVAAVKAAGLVETLKSDGPFTVFAPNDEAFAKLPQEKLNALLKDKKALTKVLTYHVVPGKVMSSDVANLKTAKTVEGQALSISSKDGVQINNANVIMTDIITTNGVIHVVDTVILPPDMMASL